MDLTWLDPAQLRDRDVAGAASVLEAARHADAPYRVGQTVQQFTARIRLGRDGTPPVTALARDRDGAPVGFIGLSFPGWDNRHMAELVVTVDPLRRGSGLGRRLFEAGLDRVRQEGRSVLIGHGADSPALSGFATAMGMAPVLTIAARRLDLRAVDGAWLAREHAAAEAHGPAYELVRLPGETPEEMMPAMVALTAAINDAPIDDMAVDDQAFSAERLRAYERGLRAGGQRVYRLLARCRDSGELAGHTVVGVDQQRPWYGFQHDTSVVGAHRGHRLGVRLKVGMMQWLAEVEPQLHSIDTTNAVSNGHMIRVNELLGYRQLGTATNWQRRL